MNATRSILWNRYPGDFTGDIGSVLALDARRWRELGAQFTPMPDNEGEEPGLAVGRIESGTEQLTFGVLDYSEEQTFLLVPASGSAKEQLANAVIKALLEAGAIVAADVMDDPSPFAVARALDERISALEQSVGESLAEAKPAAEPVAVDIVVVSTPRSSIQAEKRKLDLTKIRLLEKDRHLGTVKKFDPQEGKVYIEPADGSKIVFVKKDSLVGKNIKLSEGTPVEFRYSIARKDPQLG